MTDYDGLPTRREMGELVVRAAALPGAAAFFASWLGAAQSHQHGNLATPATPQPLRDYQAQFFSQDEFQALQAMTEILIPSDDTPGARDAYCAHYIDFVLQSASETPETQNGWRSAMAALKQTGFFAADAKQRLALVTEIDVSPQHAAYFAYRLIKQQTAFAFYTSRQGLIEALDYKGNSYNAVFPGCNHTEHQSV